MKKVVGIEWNIAYMSVCLSGVCVFSTCNTLTNFVRIPEHLLKVESQT